MGLLILETTRTGKSKVLNIKPSLGVTSCTQLGNYSGLCLKCNKGTLELSCLQDKDEGIKGNFKTGQGNAKMALKTIVNNRA